MDMGKDFNDLAFYLCPLFLKLRSTGRQSRGNLNDRKFRLDDAERRTRALSRHLDLITVTLLYAAFWHELTVTWRRSINHNCSGLITDNGQPWTRKKNCIMYEHAKLKNIRRLLRRGELLKFIVHRKISSPFWFYLCTFSSIYIYKKNPYIYIYIFLIKIL